MEDLNKIIQSIGVIGEMTGILFRSLVQTGMSEDIAITLSVKIVGEFIRATTKTDKEKNGNEAE